MILFCIPHAGGTAAQYFKWKDYLNPQIEIVPLELPGHIMRLKEPLEVNYNKVICEMSSRIKAKIFTSKEPYAIWGHSMGALLNYYLCLRLFKENLQPPIHLFISSYIAPNLHNKEGSIDIYDDDFLMQYVLELGGVDKSILEDKLLFEFFMDVIRADFNLLKSISRQSEIITVPSSLTYLYGSKESKTEIGHIEQWEKYTEAEFSSYCIKGGHFFPFTNIQHTVNIINSKLGEYSYL